MNESERSVSMYAALHAKRQAEKAADPTCDFGSVIELMGRAADELEAVPDTYEWSAAALGRLEEARAQAIRLKMEVEAIFEVLNGRPTV